MNFWNFIITAIVIVTIHFVGYIGGYNKGYAYYKQEISKK